MSYLAAYVVALVAYLALDLIGQRAAMRRLGRPRLGEVLRDRPGTAAPVVFALFYAAVLVYLAAGPGLFLAALERPLLAGWIPAAANGAILGLLAHGTREVSNMATLRNWPASLALAGILRGVVASALAALAGYLAAAAWAG